MCVPATLLRCRRLKNANCMSQFMAENLRLSEWVPCEELAWSVVRGAAGKGRFTWE